MRLSLQVLALLLIGMIAFPILSSFIETGAIVFHSLFQTSQITQEIQANLEHFFLFLFWGFIKDTFCIALLVCLLSSLIGVSCAYLVTHFDFLFSRILEKLLFLPLAIPSYILAFVYVGIVDYRVDLFNLYGVVFILSFSLFPYIYLFAKNSFSTQAPELYEVAKIMKYSPWQIFYKVSLVVAYPAILSGTLLVLMETLSDYGVSAYLGVNTFSAGIFKLWYDLGDTYSSSILTALLLVFVFTLMVIEQRVKNKRKYSLNQNTQIFIKRTPLQGLKFFLAFAYCGGIAFIGFLLPLSWLLYWGLQDSKLFEWEFYLLALNSLLAGGLSATLALFCALFLCFVIRITKSPFFSSIIMHSSSLGYAIPSATVGVSVMIASVFLSNLLSIPLLGTSLSLLIFAYIVRFLATAIYSIQNGYEKICNSLDEVGLSIKKSYFTLFFKLHAPLLKHFILSALLIVFVDTIKELPITRMLSPFGFETLATKAFWYATDERLYDSALPSLLIVLLSLIAIIILNSRSKEC